jgi:hypothetical protein
MRVVSFVKPNNLILSYPSEEHGIDLKDPIVVAELERLQTEADGDHGEGGDAAGGGRRGADAGASEQSAVRRSRRPPPPDVHGMPLSVGDQAQARRDGSNPNSDPGPGPGPGPRGPRALALALVPSPTRPQPRPRPRPRPGSTRWRSTMTRSRATHRPALEDRLMRQYSADRQRETERAGRGGVLYMMSTSRRVGVAGRWGIAAFCSHAPCAV